MNILKPTNEYEKQLLEKATEIAALEYPKLFKHLNSPKRKDDDIIELCNDIILRYVPHAKLALKWIGLAAATAYNNGDTNGRFDKTKGDVDIEVKTKIKEYLKIKGFLSDEYDWMEIGGKAWIVDKYGEPIESVIEQISATHQKVYVKNDTRTYGWRDFEEVYRHILDCPVTE